MAKTKDAVVQTEKDESIKTISVEKFVRGLNVFACIAEISEVMRDEIAKNKLDLERGVLQVRFVAPLLDIDQLDNFPAPLIADKKAAAKKAEKDESGTV